MPAGAVNVTFIVNEPESGCVVSVDRVNVPSRSVPLSEPTPSAVVPVKEFPAKVSCGTPVTVPVVEPETVTSSARATLCAKAMNARAKTLSASGFTNARMRFVIMLPPSFLPNPCSYALPLVANVGRRSGARSLLTISGQALNRTLTPLVKKLSGEFKNFRRQSGAIRGSRKFNLCTTILAVKAQFFRNFRKVEWNLQASRGNVKENFGASVPSEASDGFPKSEKRRAGTNAAPRPVPPSGDPHGRPHFKPSEGLVLGLAPASTRGDSGQARAEQDHGHRLGHGRGPEVATSLPPGLTFWKRAKIA